MPNLYPLARPLLWRLQPETAHKVALWLLRARLGKFATSRRARAPAHPILSQTIWGISFANPFGVAAGFDKDACAPAEFLRLGFGSVEVGTVTPRPQSGNELPRIFRLSEDDAIINRMGFPSKGLDAVIRCLPSVQRPGILGINIGRNKDSVDALADYVEGLRRTAPIADYLVVNVSSPNTPGLRDLQLRAPLESLLSALLKAREGTGFNPPVLVKIAPDLSTSERTDIAAVALAVGLDGIVISNTTIARPQGLQSAGRREAGGLSGPPLFDKSTELLAEMYSLTNGKLPLIGVGGVATAADAYAKIRAGASLVQLHTALIYKGLNLIADLKDGLVDLLQADGFTNIRDAIGSAHPVGPFAPSRMESEQFAPATRSSGVVAFPRAAA